MLCRQWYRAVSTKASTDAKGVVGDAPKMAGLLSISFTCGIFIECSCVDFDPLAPIKQAVATDLVQGTSFALGVLQLGTPANQTNSIKIMVSAWWLLWAFVAGGYAGMLLVALLAITRKTPGDSAFE